jgi:hypothetical protein
MRSRWRIRQGCVIFHLFSICFLWLMLWYPSKSTAAENRYAAVDHVLDDISAHLQSNSIDEDVERVERLLREAINASTPVSQIKERDITARLSLLEGLKQARSAVQSSKSLIALRKIVDCLYLVQALRQLQEAQLAEGSDQLSAIQATLWGDLKQYGNGSKLKGDQIFAESSTSVLLHRTFLSENGSLSSFELVGSPKNHEARWIETRFPTIGEVLSEPIEQAIRVTGKGLLRWRFALVAAPGNEQESAEMRTAILQQIGLLRTQAILPLIVEPPDQKHPILDLPVMKISGSIGSLKLEGLSLVDLESKANVRLTSIGGLVIRRNVNASVAVASSVASEINPKNSRAEDAELQLPALPLPTYREKVDDKTFAPTRHIRAGEVDSSTLVDLAPEEPIELEGVTSTNWGRFYVPGQGSSVWISLRDVATKERERTPDDAKRPLEEGNEGHVQAVIPKKR